MNNELTENVIDYARKLETQNKEMLELLKKFHTQERSTTLRSNIYILVDQFLKIKEQE